MLFSWINSHFSLPLCWMKCGRGQRIDLIVNMHSVSTTHVFKAALTVQVMRTVGSVSLHYNPYNKLKRMFSIIHKRSLYIVKFVSRH